jgi:hypothetical protein
MTGQPSAQAAQLSHASASTGTRRSELSSESGRSGMSLFNSDQPRRDARYLTETLG